MSYETATFRGLLWPCYRIRLRRWYDQTDFDKETHRVIGGAIVGTNGGELLGEIGLAIEMGCDAEDIAH
ncbi:hypothetical protein ACVXG7_01255 [Enterobacter hormaechei]